MKLRSKYKRSKPKRTNKSKRSKISKSKRSKRSKRSKSKRSKRSKIKKSKRSKSKKSKRSKSQKLKLIKIVKSPNKKKKYRAYFNNGKHTDFGAVGYSDYIHHKDDERKGRYILRHMKNENWKDPTKAGTLSLYILWNKKTLKASIADYKRKFKL